MAHMITNICVQFNYDRLYMAFRYMYINKALGNFRKSDRNNKKQEEQRS